MAARKQTSDRVSRIAARVLRLLSNIEGARSLRILGCTVGELKALAASALSQDEQKGKRKARRK